MKKSRFSEEQITYALRLVDGGSSVAADVCRQLGISEATLYVWKKKKKKKYANLGVSELRQLHQLQEERSFVKLETSHR